MSYTFPLYGIQSDNRATLEILNLTMNNFVILHPYQLIKICLPDIEYSRPT